MGETFKLNFITNGEGIVTIAEPEGFDGVDFNLKQRDKGYGRDISFAGGEVQFTFYRMNNHYFETIMYYFETFGWESEVKLIIEKEGIANIIGDLDFKEADTDQLEYFSCKVIQDSNRAILERRADVKVDVFSSEDIDGEVILPLATENILVKAKPITQISNWGVSIPFWAFTGTFVTSRVLFQNPLNVVEGYEIADTLSFLDRYIITSAGNSPTSLQLKNFAIIEAQDNLSNLTITIENLLISYFISTGGNFDDNSYLVGIPVRPYIELYIGTDDNVQSIARLGATLTFTKEFIGNESVSRFGVGGTADRWDLTFDTKTINVGNIPRGFSLYAIFFMDRYNTYTEWLEGNMIARATSIAYNTIAPSIRLYDAVSQVVLSTSGLATSFPFAEVNGEMYNQRLLNGNLLRNILDRPFNITLKDIGEWIVEINGDYEVQNDSTVFFGKYADFYTNVEVGVFTGARFDDYKKSFNKKYAINLFSYGYKKFQAQKENEVENTFDVVHGESQWSVLNKFVENKKEVKISFVRDAFYIEEQRKKAISESNSTSTQDDDTIFIVDTLETTADSVFEETDFLQHTYDVNTSTLKLSNTGSFSFILIGLAVGETFEILGGDSNSGTYTITNVSSNSVSLSGTSSANNDGERVTSFRYIVSLSTARYITWTNEGFNYIDNINNPNSYANLKYTVKRNIRRFYNQYLATANSYTNSAIKNTEYKNNGALSLSYEGMQTVESEPLTPDNPILSPYTHKITLVTDFNTYKALEDSVKTDRGYIRTFDAKGLVIKIYPMEMKFMNNAEYGELTIFGEEKTQPSLINIIYGNIGYLTINDEYRTTNIIYKNEGEIFYIFDALGKLLYNPVFWQKITINDAVPTSKEQLIEWLSLIS